MSYGLPPRQHGLPWLDGSWQHAFLKTLKKESTMFQMIVPSYIHSDSKWGVRLLGCVLICHDSCASDRAHVVSDPAALDAGDDPVADGPHGLEVCSHHVRCDLPCTIAEWQRLRMFWGRTCQMNRRFLLSSCFARKLQGSESSKSECLAFVSTSARVSTRLLAGQEQRQLLQVVPARASRTLLDSSAFQDTLCL